MDKYGTAPSMDRKQKRGRQGLGEEVGSYFAGTEFQFCKMTGVPWTGGGDGRVATCVSLPPLDCTLKNGYDDKFSVTCVLPQFKKKKALKMIRSDPTLPVHKPDGRGSGKVKRLPSAM